MARAGPVTVFVVRDSGWVFPNGQTVPKCVFDALGKPGNEHIIQGIFHWFALPGGLLTAAVNNTRSVC